MTRNKLISNFAVYHVVIEDSYTNKPYAFMRQFSKFENALKFYNNTLKTNKVFLHRSKKWHHLQEDFGGACVAIIDQLYGEVRRYSNEEGFNKVCAAIKPR